MPVPEWPRFGNDRPNGSRAFGYGIGGTQNTKLKALTKMAEHRWIIERDYEELKQRVRAGAL